MKPQISLLDRIEEIKAQDPVQGASYYCVTLLGNENGKINRYCQSVFCGYTESKPRREIRSGCLVEPTKMRDLLRSINEPPVIVNTANDLYIFLLIGGHGIIEKRLGEKHFGDSLAAKATIFSHTKGHLLVSGSSRAITQHAPSRKTRMKVLKRDNYRCKVCGRSPEKNVDIELHVHHIHPWGEGGVTDEENLITLCDTCHDGLDPHFDLDLFPLIGVRPYVDIIKAEPTYVVGVVNYRKISVQAFKSHAEKMTLGLKQKPKKALHPRKPAA